MQFFAEGRIFSDVLFFYSLRGFDDTTGRQNRKVGQYILGPCVKYIPVKSEFKELKKKNPTSLVEEPKSTCELTQYIIRKLAKWLDVELHVVI